jgi:hypothetical protein
MGIMLEKRDFFPQRKVVTLTLSPIHNHQPPNTKPIREFRATSLSSHNKQQRPLLNRKPKEKEKEKEYKKKKAGAIS